LLTLAGFASSNNAWSLELALPNVPAAQGIDFALQAAVVPSLAPRGFDLSDGVWVELGY
jgi:hypothetical protein